MDLQLTPVDLKAWLKTNRNHFLYDNGGYDREEVTELALLAGFDRRTIYQELSHFEDALRGSNFDKRAEFHIQHETLTIEMLSGKHGLSEQWEALYNKIEWGKDWDDQGGSND